MSRVDEVRKRLEAAKGKEVVMDFPLYVDAAVREAVIHGTSDLYWLLGRVEKLEGLLSRLVAAADDSEMDFEDLGKFAWTHLAEASALLADESKENEHGSK